MERKTCLVERGESVGGVRGENVFLEVAVARIGSSAFAGVLSDAETEESLAASSRAILLLLSSNGVDNTTTRSKKNAQQTR